MTDRQLKQLQKIKEMIKNEKKKTKSKKLNIKNVEHKLFTKYCINFRFPESDIQIIKKWSAIRLLLALASALKYSQYILSINQVSAKAKIQTVFFKRERMREEKKTEKKRERERGREKLTENRP